MTRSISALSFASDTIVPPSATRPAILSPALPKDNSWPRDHGPTRDVRRRRVRHRGDAPDPRRASERAEPLTSAPEHLAELLRVRDQLRDDRDPVGRPPRGVRTDRACVAGVPGQLRPD